MNWDELKASDSLKQVLKHYQKLGQFRAKHPAVGAGKHELVSENPLIFIRSINNESFSDKVLIGVDLGDAEIEIDVNGIFSEKNNVSDFYSGRKYPIENGKIKLKPINGIILLESH